MSESKKVLIVVTASIAAVKVYDLIRLLREKGYEVTIVLTDGAKQFVTPMACTRLSGNKVYDDLFSLDDELNIGHIELSRDSDLLLVAPASADILAKMVHGICDGLATTMLLATDKPVMVAPAMNVKMWENPANQRNIKQLEKDGVTFIGPVDGPMACGETGIGRMSEVDDIIAAVDGFFLGSSSESLAGKKALVTTGPTVEAVDPVRYLSNRSSGKQGMAIAEALAKAGAEVVLVSGPTKLADPKRVKVTHVESAREMMQACEAELPVDIAICAAAVADWGVSEVSKEKIKKSSVGDNFTLSFAENPDILASLAKRKAKRPKLVVGFAAESEHVVENARVKLEQKQCDLIVANDISGGAVFEDDENTVHVIGKDTEEDWPTMSKQQVAEKLVTKITEEIG